MEDKEVELQVMRLEIERLKLRLQVQENISRVYFNENLGRPKLKLGSKTWATILLGPTLSLINLIWRLLTE